MIRLVTHTGLGLSLIPIVVLVGVGTASYSALEGWSILDALYATIITITTVGYGDLSPQTLGGKIFAILFTLSAIGLASYAISTLAAVVIDWEQNRLQRRIQEQRMQNIADLRDHIVICGGSSIGRTAAIFFQRAKQPIILVEHDEEKLRRSLLYLDVEFLKKKFGRYHDITQAVDVTEDEQLSLEALAERVHVPYLLADPTDDTTLMAAGIDRAKGLVAALDSDERNVFAVVSARALATQLENPNVRIIALVHDDKNGPKLQIAGADQVVLPEKGSAVQLQVWMMNPLVGDFWMNVTFKGASHDIQQVSLVEQPAWVAQTIAQLRLRQNTLVLALKRDGEFHYAPADEEILRATDELVAFAPKAHEDTA